MKICKKVTGCVLIGILLFLVYLMIAYSPQYIISYIFYGEEPGNLTYQKFSTREIKKSDTVFHFRKKVDEDYIESLFNDKIRFFRLNTFEEYIELTNTTALIVIKNDTIIYEKYFNGFHREDMSMAMSMTKSYVNSLIGIAIDEGYIKSVNEPITNYLPELTARDPRFQQIKLKHLLMMCSGIDRHKSTIKGIPLPWDGKSIAFAYPRIRQYLLHRLDISSEPGKRFDYVDYNTELLGLILERAINKSVSEYLEEKLWKPCGMEYQALWSLHSEKRGFEIMNGGLYARPIDYAKYGRLYLNHGNWEGKQIISKEWVIESTEDEATLNIKGFYPPIPTKWLNNTYYKYHWKGHLNLDSSKNFSIGGVMGQNIFIAPHKDLIIVRCGNSHANYGVEDLWDIERQIDNPFYNILHSEGLTQAIEYVDSLLQTDQNNTVSERQLNTIGYGFIYQENLDDAIAILKLNVRCYSKSSNVYDSLAEAYMKNGQKKLAIKNYKKSLELNPDNVNAREMLNNLKN